MLDVPTEKLRQQSWSIMGTQVDLSSIRKKKWRLCKSFFQIFFQDSDYEWWTKNVYQLEHLQKVSLGVNSKKIH